MLKNFEKFRKKPEIFTRLCGNLICFLTNNVNGQLAAELGMRDLPTGLQYTNKTVKQRQKNSKSTKKMSFLSNNSIDN